MPPLGQDFKPGLSARFKVVVDAVSDLGRWSVCKGLKVDFKFEDVKAGGVYDHQVRLPKQVQYGAVTLKRAVSSQDSPKVQQWLAQKAKEYTDERDWTASEAVITLMDHENKEVQTWTLRGVFPQTWSGPDMDANGKTVATETLVLVHEGFLARD